jgi:two-component system LytT family response regulator
MKKYRAIIIDDEYHVREAMRQLVEQNCPELTICGSASSASDGRSLIEKEEVDLIFLDISMPGEDGFSFLTTIDSSKYAIIFVTAYHEFALKALKASAVDYLMKPVDHNELKVAVHKAVDYLEVRRVRPKFNEVYSLSMANLKKIISAGNQCVEKITVPDQFGFRIVEVRDIMYMEADGSYTIFHFSGLDKLVVSKPLGEIENLLDGCGFFRIHKSTILNLRFLKGYSSYQGNFAELVDGTKLDISRRKLLEFKDAVGSFTKAFK